MATMRLTMIGAYKYDPELFSSLDLPSAIDRETAINNIVVRCGESPLLYDNPDFIKLMIGTWSKKWKDSIERMLLALEEEYNPLHNFDRYEKYDDERHNTDSNRTDSQNDRTSTYNRSITENTEGEEGIDYSGNDETINLISAFNSNEYQPNNKSTLDSSNNSDRDYNESKTTSHGGSDSTSDVLGESKNGKFDETSKHDGHLYGNIGVTTSQQMLQAELDLRSKVNIYDVIAEMFYKEFCVYVY